MLRILLVLAGALVCGSGWAALQFEDQRAPPAPQAPRPQRPPRTTPEPPIRRVEPPVVHADANMLTDPRSRCAVWVPDPEPGESVQWSGTCSNGMAQGAGELLRQLNGAVKYLYQGSFEAGRLVGRASRVGANGERLEAEFRGGRANGPGTMEFRDGVYEGEFRDDMPNGGGVRTWRNMRPWLRYEGQWERGMRNGAGSMDYGNGTFYVGNWRNDRRHGVGRMDYGNGTRYEGNWRDDRREGQGTYRWDINGSAGMYVGEWQNDRRNGTGSEVFTTLGARIDGQFVNDAADGPGLYIVGERRIQGVIRNGCLRTERGEMVRILANANCR